MGEKTDGDDDRLPVVKAHFVGRDGSEMSNVLETDTEQRKLFENRGAIEPPLDPLTLAHLFEMSGALRTNIDAYATNIDGHGHGLHPTFDTEDDETFDKVKQAMIEERIRGDHVEDTAQAKAAKILKANAPNRGANDKPTGYNDEDEIPGFSEPTNAEVQARVAAIDREMVRERIRLEQFFEFCCVDESFTSLRTRTRQDLETLGNAYWEVLRNQDGDIVQLTYIPGFMVRLLPQDPSPVSVRMPIRTTAITETDELVHKRFRRFVQVVDQSSRRIVYFKEFGDPRTVSAKTGNVYDDLNAAKRAEARDSNAKDEFVPASEVIHFKIHNSRTPYGVPRWVSEMLSVLGARHADEINLAYFENKSIPPMAILVSGGRLRGDTTKRLENYITNEIRGKKNFHKILILEAEPQAGIGGATSSVKVEMKPLTGAMQDDALFQNYREKNVDSIGSVFRLPRLLRGDARDFNRATAQTSLEFAEQQVFAPLRREFDFVINRKILTDFGVRFWRFESKGPDFSDPADLLKAVGEASKSGYATPEELREIAGRGFNYEFPKIDAPWATERPMMVTVEGVRTGAAHLDGGEFTPEELAAGEEGNDTDDDDDLIDEDPDADDDADDFDDRDDIAQALRVRSPHDMAMAAAGFSDYADALSFYESHDDENTGDDV